MHAGDRDDAGDQQRAGERPDLVQRLLHGEPAAASDRDSDACEQRGLRRAPDGLAGALEQDQGRGQRQPETADERCHGQQRDADGRHGVPEDGQRPVAAAAVGERPGEESQDQRQCFAGAGDELRPASADAPRDAQERPGHRAHALVDHVAGEADQSERDDGAPRRPDRRGSTVRMTEAARRGHASRLGLAQRSRCGAEASHLAVPGLVCPLASLAARPPVVAEASHLAVPWLRAARRVRHLPVLRLLRRASCDQLWWLERRGLSAAAHLERYHATWRMQWFARGAPGPLGAYGEVATNGWRVCGPRPQSSQSKGRTVGDTRLVAVISTRIGCGVSDATARVGSRMTGDPAMFCTWPPMLSIAVSSGVLAAVVQMDDERVMPRFRRLRRPLAVLARVGTPSLDSGGLAAQTVRRPLIGHAPKKFAWECHCLSVNMARSPLICDI